LPQVKIVREEQDTGGPNRTPREEIVPLVTGKRGAEPEFYLDCSESEIWPWDSDPSKNTWSIQLEALRQCIVPFEIMDTEAAEEQAGGSDEMGGVYTYPFNHEFVPMGDGDDGGDLNSANFQRKMDAFIRKYGVPGGGTKIMSAIKAADDHFLGEFGPGGEEEQPVGSRPIRVRVVWTDGALKDEKEFRNYLNAAKLDKETGLGDHGEWLETWAVAIIGEEGGGGHEAHRQYQAVAKDHPWVHSYYFANVVNPSEIAEDMAVATVPASS
jgi:hypothetical protein